MTKQDGWSSVGHFASTNNPHRDIGPKQAIPKSEAFERRFFTCTNVKGKGKELLSKRRIRHSYDWETRWDGSYGKGIDSEIPEYDSLSDPHAQARAILLLRQQKNKKEPLNFKFLKLENRVQENARRENESSVKWTARLVNGQDSKFRVPKVDNQELESECRTFMGYKPHLEDFDTESQNIPIRGRDLGCSTWED